MNISIETIPHNLQRYDTVGDWAYEENKFSDVKELKINVSDMGNEDYEFLVGLHELIEAYLCRKAGITTEQVDEWDMNWKGEGEPGEDPRAPYCDQHDIATRVENFMSSYLCINWENYEQTIDALTQKKDDK